MGKEYNVFISYHHKSDGFYRNRFEQLFTHQFNVIASQALPTGKIDPKSEPDTIRSKMRSEYLKNTTVTVVLIGTETWQRQQVDWEIASSIRDTEQHPRSGLFGIFLPCHDDCNRKERTPFLMPPRLYDNVTGGYAKLYDWTEAPLQVVDWVRQAHLERSLPPHPDNKRPLLKTNHSGDSWKN